MKTRVLVILLLALTLTACNPPPPSPNAGRSPAGATPYPRESREPRRERRSSDTGQPNSGRRNSSRASSSTSGDFDFYLLNLSWSPEFCATHPSRPECSQHLGFVLHGLWPQNNDGSYPEHCSDAPGPADPSSFRDLYPDAGLLRHEWQTHGTCSGRSPDDFFNEARRAVHNLAIPRELTATTQQTSLPPTAILDLFAAANPSLDRASLALSCGNNYLTAVELCLDKSLHPVACQGVRSCRANTVRIPPRNR